MTRGNMLNNPTLHDFLGDLFCCPMTDGAFRWRLTGQRDDLTTLFCRDLWRFSWAWDVLKPLGDRELRKRDRLQTAPTSTPGVNYIDADSKCSGNLRISSSLCCCQYDSSAFRQLLRGAIPMDQCFQSFLFFLTECQFCWLWSFLHLLSYHFSSYLTAGVFPPQCT